MTNIYSYSKQDKKKSRRFHILIEWKNSYRRIYTNSYYWAELVTTYARFFGAMRIDITDNRPGEA